MILKHILGIPVIEAAAPSDFVAEQDRELYAQIQAAIDRLRCAACGSLNFDTTLFVFSAGIEKLTECRNCGGVRREMLGGDDSEPLAFLPRLLSAPAGSLTAR